MKIDKRLTAYVVISAFGTCLTIIFQIAAIVLFDKSEYGKFSTINAAFTAIAIGFSTVPWTLQRTAKSSLVPSRIVQHFRYFGKSNQLAPFEVNILKLSIWGSSIILITVIMLFFFYDERALGYASLSIFLPASALNAIGFGRLQISGNLLTLNKYSSLLAALRLAPLILLFFVELDPAMVLALIAIIYLFYADYLNTRVNSGNANHDYDSGRQPYYSLVVNLFFWILLSLDLLVVRLSFSADSAGSYSIIGNLVRFGVIPVFYLVQTYFHSARKFPDRMQQDFRSLLSRVTIYWILFTLIFLIGIEIISELFPDSSFVAILSNEGNLPLGYTLVTYFLVIAIPASQLILPLVGKYDLVFVAMLIFVMAFLSIFSVTSSAHLVLLQLATYVIFLIYISIMYSYRTRKC
jgi:hypothetical protein